MRKILLLTILLSSAFFVNAQTPNIIVAKDGSGNFTSVQAAINAAPTGLTAPYIILIKNGKYIEKITVPSNKPFIHLIGESVANVILSYNDGASTPIAPCSGSTIGTQNSASFTVNATDFAAFNITFENSYGDGTQAVAVLVNADKAIFKNCRMLGNQDTLYVKGAGAPRHYFKNCYIDGNVDFIFGSSIAVFDSCIIVAKTRPATSISYITAPNTPNGQTYGFVFRDCRLLSNIGTTAYYLSRPWQNTGGNTSVHNKAVLLNPVYGSTLLHPAGWSTWDATTNTALTYYAEFNARNEDGSSYNISNRVAWSYQLNSTEAASYSLTNIFGSWNPCSIASTCIYTPSEIVVSNFKVKKGASNTEITWNTTWPISGVQMDLYRSTSYNGAYSLINSQTTTDTITTNFSYIDALPANGSAYFYYLVASKTGSTSHTTDTLISSNLPAISTSTNSICGISQSIGAPSISYTFILNGSNLTNDIVITPTAPYEISLNGTTWISAPGNLTVPQTSGNINRTIFVRLNAIATGTYNTILQLSSIGASNQSINLYGACFPPVTATTLQRWPLTTNGNDDIASRANGILPSSPTLNKYNLSAGVVVPAVPAYSTVHGRAIGICTGTTDGSFSTNATTGCPTGINGNLNRTYYEQYTITAAPDYTLKVDSIILTTAFFNTANAQLSIVWSRSGFVSDSANVTSVTTQFATSDSGSFTKPIRLTNQTSGPTAVYRFALNGATGVVRSSDLTAGQPLTIRLYMTNSSSSAGRYNVMKDVIIKGTVTNLLPLNLLSFNGSLINTTAHLNWKTSQEVNVDMFEIERSNDGVNFTKIGIQRAYNLANNIYHYQDMNPFVEGSYYRLKTIDKDRKFSYSKIIFLKQLKKATITISPNPTQSEVRIQMPTSESHSIRILDGQGKLVHQETLIGWSTTVSLTHLQTGTYTIRVLGLQSNKQYFEKIIKY